MEAQKQEAREGTGANKKERTVTGKSEEQI
jgi:hypothetical protein